MEPWEKSFLVETQTGEREGKEETDPEDYDDYSTSSFDQE